MYNSQEISLRIKDRAKEKNVSINQMLLKCELGKNTITKMSNGTDILTQNFAKIADYLDCSVDYLLGRTDKPNNQTTLNGIYNPTTIKGNAVVKGNNSSIIHNETNTNDLPINNENSEQEFSKQAIELAKIFDSLGIREQTAILSTVFKIEAESQKK